MTLLSDQFADWLTPDKDGIVKIPVLVKGRLVFPPTVSIDRLMAASRQWDRASTVPAGKIPQTAFSLDGVRVIRQAVSNRSTVKPSGPYQFLLFGSPEPQALIETDSAALADDLYHLPFKEVQDYVRRLRETLESQRPLIRRAAQLTHRASVLDHRLVESIFDQLPYLLDPRALGEAVDRELGSSDIPGRRYLDGWCTVDSRSHRGLTSRMQSDFFGGQPEPAPDRFIHRTRAIPTRQLHITAGNAPVLPFLSFLRGLATKSAMVIKSPGEATAINALLTLGVLEAAPDHPITRHTSLVYWKGGDPAMENALFSPNAFDRVIVWGAPETVRSVQKRSIHAKTLFLNPRYGLSLIGKEAFSGDIEPVAVRACTDSMIANQNACMSSLVHYVEADEAQALDYCRVLQQTLQKWDRMLPHALPRAVLGRLRLLRRKEFFKGTWFENGRQPDISSSVVFMPEPFDISVHPMARCIVVRPIARSRDIMPFLSASVSTVGVWPETLRTTVRDAMAASGVSNILPLGECERVYAGMPHDGMRMLSEMVNWTNG